MLALNHYILLNTYIMLDIIILDTIVLVSVGSGFNARFRAWVHVANFVLTFPKSLW